MSANSAVNIVVASRSEETSEALNRLLRNAGIAARCAWASDKARLDQALNKDPDLIIIDIDHLQVTAADHINIRGKASPRLPILWLTETLTETIQSQAFQASANDVVTLRDGPRLVGICERETRLAEIEQSLDATMDSAMQFKEQMKVLMADSTDALAYVQEGVIVDVNPAWLSMLGYANEDDVLALPVMDFFKAESRGPLKGAIVATMKGKWGDDELDCVAISRDDDAINVKLTLTATRYDGEPCVKVNAVADQTGPNTRELKLRNDALNKDQATLLYHRSFFTELVQERLKKPLESGTRVLAWVRPDRFADVARDVGRIESERVFAELADLAREQLLPNDISGRFEGLAVVVLLERGRLQDAENWAQRLVDRVSKHVFRVGKQSTKMTCTVGLCRASEELDGLGALLNGASDALARGRDSGGNATVTNETTGSESRIQSYDAIWLRHLKSALIENRFRLLQQPIVGLDGADHRMFDLLVRMIDQQGKPVLPSEFIPAAERNNMMQAIDRWVIAAALEFCRQKSPQTVFLKLSYQSVHDATMGNWLAQQIRGANINPKQLCFEISEECANRYLQDTKAIREIIRRLGARFALEHVGTGDNRAHTVEHLEPDFVKIDGNLIAGIAGDSGIQTQVQRIVELAKGLEAQTIAERVEDANTMAVLWQLGIQFMQGHYVNEPEVVLQDSPIATEGLQLQA